MTRNRPSSVLVSVLVATLVTGCGLGLAGELVIPPSQDPGGDAASSDDGSPDPSGDGGGGIGSDDGPAMSNPPGGPEGGAPEGGKPGQCNFTGYWGTKLTIPVNWMPQGLTAFILASGSGTINQWILGARVQSGNTLTDTTIVCGIDLPDFMGTFINLEAYGVRFPDTLFDHVPHYLPTFMIAGTVNNSSPMATYTTKPAAALLGINISSPATGAWPSSSEEATAYQVDSDMDGHPGVTATTAQGSGYDDIPVDGAKSARASSVYVVIRQVTQVNGAASDCDHFAGAVTIPQLPVEGASGTKYAIDSHVIGCGLDGDGGTCDSTQTDFLDNTQPVFTPTGGATFASVRLPMGATCATVRAMLP